ncbi:MAG: sulfatase-like hydrolase/transferase [Planctomycetota bacterium]
MPALLWQPYVTIPAINTAATLFYLWPDLPELDIYVLFSLLVSALGATALYYIVFAVLPPRKCVAIPVAALFAALLTVLHVVQFGYYRVFGSIMPPSAVNYLRLYPAHALREAYEELTVLHAVVGAAAIALLTWYCARAILKVGGTLRRRQALAAVLLFVLAPVAATWPCLALDQYFAGAVLVSMGTDFTKIKFVPERVDLPALRAEQPPNVVFFLLESVSRDAAQVYNPRLPTMPFWTQYVEEHADEAFLAGNHFSNSSASDMAIPMVFNGTAPDDPMPVHVSAPLLWDYATSAGYNTSLYIAASFEWGGLGVRFQHHTGHTNLDHAFHAGNAGRPLVHDLSMNDEDVVGGAIEYQQARGWQGPFLMAMNLKMPHYLGQGARMNGYAYLNDRLPDEDRLIHYYNAVYDGDRVMANLMAAMPPEVRRNTIVVVASDHGEDLYGRGVRLENYHQEIAQVPCWFVVPGDVQRRQRPGAMEILHRNLETTAASNVDLLPTVLDLMGLADEPHVAEVLEGLQGQSLLRERQPPEFLVMLNTNDLRNWEREGFALTMDNGTKRYVFDMGREGFFDLRTDPREETSLMDDPRYADDLQRARAEAEHNPFLRRIVAKYSDGRPTSLGRRLLARLLRSRRGD